MPEPRGKVPHGTARGSCTVCFVVLGSLSGKVCNFPKPPRDRFAGDLVSRRDRPVFFRSGVMTPRPVLRTRVRRPSSRWFRPQLETLEDRTLLSVYSSVILADQPSGFWQLGETAGTTAVDSSGNGLNGTYTGGFTLGKPGGVANDPHTSVGFDGSTSYADMGNPASLTYTTQFTVEAWVFPTSAGNNGIIVNHENEYEIAVWPNGDLQWAVANTTPGWAWHDTHITIPIGQWTFVDWVYNPGGVINTYVNGTLGESFAGAGNIGNAGVGTNNFRIGGRQSGGQYFLGQIEDVAVYNYALTQGQIVNHFATAGNGGFSFAAPLTPTSGTSNTSWQLATGDFNNDGNLDLVVEDYSGNKISVLLNNGSGTLTASGSSPFATGSGPNGVAVGDFNNDGNLDLAIANYGASTVSIYLGNGSGGFNPGQVLSNASISKPIDLIANDFNHDGNLDLAVSNNGLSTITLLTGTGTGTFNVGASVAAGGSSSNFLSAGDVNGDGNLDLVQGNTNNTVSVLLSNSAGVFTLVGGAGFSDGVATAKQSVAIGDFNGDGKMDLAIANTSNISIMIGNGSGGFSLGPQTPITTGSNPYQILAADFNGDGKLDLAVTNNGSATLSLLLGVGNGTFLGPLTFTLPSNPSAVLAGDFNNDGAPDMVVGFYSSSKLVQEYLNYGGTRTALPLSPPPRRPTRKTLPSRRPSPTASVVGRRSTRATSPSSMERRSSARWPSTRAARRSSPRRP